ncbi:MAG TPA: PQQ-binding-like beta-propeller repeat protein, partial [Candidatus Dormibacteraeota bacterium]|nr:PQQ-binding-like beta-propeller repeat protein [Candidatus Dormibacteraeota bacterium]
GGGGNVLTAIRPGTPDHKPELAYQIKKAAPYVPTSVAQKDLAWLWSDAGIVTCINAATGEARYQERVGGNYFGSPVLADGKIYCVSKTGELVVLEASDKFNVLDRFAMNDVCESTPAIALGRLFVRTESHLWCFGNKEQVAP